jgi:hypothetical protein
MVYQLGQVFPKFREHALKEIEEDPGIFELSREALVNRLFVNKFGEDAHLTGADTFQPRLIAIDGLDECNDRHIQRDLLCIIASIVPSLRFPFRFFIACRPESHLMEIINHDPFYQSPYARRLDLGDASNIKDDVRTFLENEFQNIRATHPLRRYIPAHWPPEDVISMLVEKASGQFIFAATVAKFVASPKHRPENQLQIILGLSPQANENPFALLDALYKYIFSCVDDLQTVGHVLGIIHLLSVRVEHHTELRHLDTSSRLFANFSRPSHLEEILKLQCGEIELKLGELASVVRIPSSRTVPINIMHASLIDFLLDSSRSGPYALDLSVAHQTFAECAGRAMSLKTEGIFIYTLVGVRLLNVSLCRYGNH